MIVEDMSRNKCFFPDTNITCFTFHIYLWHIYWFFLLFNCSKVYCVRCVYIVTWQPIVGLCSRALLGSRQLNASRPNTRSAAVGEAVFAPFRAVPSRTAPSAATQQAAMTSHGSTLVSKAKPVNTVTGQQATVPLVWLRVYKRNGHV
jgi:hypothetical protein